MVFVNVGINEDFVRSSLKVVTTYIPLQKRNNNNSTVLAKYILFATTIF